MPKYRDSILALTRELEQKETVLRRLSEAIGYTEDQYASDADRAAVIWNEIKELESSVTPRQGLLGRVFPSNTSQDLRKRLAVKNLERNKLLQRMWEASEIETRKRSLADQVSQCRAKISSLKRSAAASEERERRTIERQAKANERLLTVKAKAAAFDEASRDLASQVKKRLSVQTYCPYCGGKLGAEMHADHIYPLSKGGLSISSNMVFVCVTCNMKKRDMTLNTFIRKFNLVRADIERRLDRLGKEY
jgi:5-methylcytosine-specific restriction endonuclease McrA